MSFPLRKGLNEKLRALAAKWFSFFCNFKIQKINSPTLLNNKALPKCNLIVLFQTRRRTIHYFIFTLDLKIYGIQFMKIYLNY